MDTTTDMPILCRSRKPEQLVHGDMSPSGIRDRHGQVTAWMTVSDDELADIPTGCYHSLLANHPRELRPSDQVLVEIDLEGVRHKNKPIASSELSQCILSRQALVLAKTQVCV